MSNPIKYNTGATQTNSIKSGNFNIGVNTSVGYGLSSATRFYNGKTPNVSGYTVYGVNSNNVPVHYDVSNDAGLISIANQFGGSGITTVGGALTYFNSSSTMVCVNVDYSNIVTDGLMLNLDAGFTPSYPKTGTTWTDLSSSGNTGTLVNGPVYSGVSNGSLVFDGVDDYMTFPTITFTNTPYTIEIIGNITGVLNSSNRRSIFGNNNFASEFSDGVTYFTNIKCDNVNSYFNFAFNTAGSIVQNVKFHWIFTLDSLKNVRIYFNGVPTTVVNTQLTGYTNIVTTFNQFGRWSGSRFFVGNVYVSRIYNRALSASEVLQNYYAGLQRFVPTDGLVLSLDAQNTNTRVITPTTAYDMSGNNNNGTLTNGVALSRDGQTSFLFDGVDDYIDIGSKVSLQPQSLSINIWFKIGVTQSSLIIRSRTYGWGINISSTSITSFLYTTSSNIITSNFSTISLNVYNHVSITYGSSIFTMYLNGVQVYTTTSPTNSIYYVGGYVGIGRDANASNSYFLGNIGQVQIYNRALTSTEISTTYNATKSRYGL